MIPTPEHLGFFMPPEWSPQTAIWTAWPHDDEQWLGELEPVRREFAMFIALMSRFERVELLVHDEESEHDARKRLDEARAMDVRLHRIAHNDLWLRDSGPIFIVRSNGSVRELALTDWRFNAWGGKYNFDLDEQVAQRIAESLEIERFSGPLVMEGGALEVNGAGLCITTEQCLENPNRNPGIDRASIEMRLREYLGIRKTIWLGQGLEGDHTDGHVDTITRFADEQTVITCVCEDPYDANHPVLENNLERLRESLPNTTIIPLSLPRTRREFAGTRLPLTYANFIILNGAVIVPIYGDANDERALEMLRKAFPKRNVIGGQASALITGGGAFHCVTQQQPMGQVLRPGALQASTL